MKENIEIKFKDSRDGTEYRFNLGTVEAMVFDTLMESFGKDVDADYIAERCEISRNYVRVTKMYLEKMLPDILQVVTVYGKGYRMQYYSELDDPMKDKKKQKRREFYQKNKK